MRKLFVNKEDLEQLYIKETKSTIEIAKILGSNKTSVLRRMKELGIPRRTVGEALKDRTMPADIRNKISKTMKVIQQGKAHSSWKGGKLISSTGYVLIWKKDHPAASRKGYVPEHRLVMEKMIGRYLSEAEVVHHINENRIDNRPENLALCEDQSAHFKKYHNCCNQYATT